MDDFIKKILIKNRIDEPYVKLKTQGIANEIYATPNFILRIPTDHPEATSDALTESVAAPVAKANGIKTPQLICFDDSFSILDKTYSIWERVHGLTLGEMENFLDFHNTWREIGIEIGKIHTKITRCHDPKNWLDNPDREYTKDMMLEYLSKAECKSSYLRHLVETKYTTSTFSYHICFVHGDTNEFNFLCSNEGKLLSVIDWGDAGFSDPAIDFYMIPIDALLQVVKGYVEIARCNFDVNFIYRIIFDKLWDGLENETEINVLEYKIKYLEDTLLKFL